MKKSSWRPAAKKIVATLVICVLSAAFIRVAWNELRLDHRYSDLLQVSRNLQLSGSKGVPKLSAYVSMSKEIVSSGVCRADILKSGLTVILADLDTRSPDSDYSAWAGRVREADTYIQHAITCLPTDGNLWVRYAMIVQATAEQPEKLSALLAMSQKFAPAEEKILAARLRLYNRVSGNTLESARKTVMADLKTAGMHQSELLAKVVEKPSTQFRSYIEDAEIFCAQDCSQESQLPRR